MQMSCIELRQEDLLVSSSSDDDYAEGDHDEGDDNEGEDSDATHTADDAEVEVVRTARVALPISGEGTTTWQTSGTVMAYTHKGTTLEHIRILQAVRRLTTTKEYDEWTRPVAAGEWMEVKTLDHNNRAPYLKRKCLSHIRFRLALNADRSASLEK